MISDETYWFEPKSHGYGAGLPTAWQGWALLGGYLLLLVAATPLIAASLIGYGAIVAAATAALLVICARKTRGGWRWRAGKEKE